MVHITLDFYRHLVVFPIPLYGGNVFTNQLSIVQSDFWAGLGKVNGIKVKLPLEQPSLTGNVICSIFTSNKFAEEFLFWEIPNLSNNLDKFIFPIKPTCSIIPVVLFGSSNKQYLVASFEVYKKELVTYLETKIVLFSYLAPIIIIFIKMEDQAFTFADLNDLDWWYNRPSGIMEKQKWEAKLDQAKDARKYYLRSSIRGIEYTVYENGHIGHDLADIVKKLINETL